MEINGEHYRLHDFGGKLVQSWTSLFSRTGILSNFYGLKVETGSIVQFRNRSFKYWTKIILKKPQVQIALVVLFQDLNRFDTCSHIIFLYCGQVYSCIWMQISLHFEELLYKNFFVVVLVRQSLCCWRGPNCTYMCICKYYELTSVVKALDLRREYCLLMIY